MTEVSNVKGGEVSGVVEISWILADRRVNLVTVLFREACGSKREDERGLRIYFCEQRKFWTIAVKPRIYPCKVFF